LRDALLFVGVVLVYFWSQGYLAKEPFSISPTEINLGDCDSPSEHVASCTVTNLSDRPIRIVGSVTDCKCLTLDELPVAVSPGHEQSISIRAYVSGRENYSQKVILYIDDNGLLSSVVQIHARVRQSPQADKNSAAAAVHSHNSFLGG
jgi:hypothetical protein